MIPGLLKYGHTDYVTKWTFSSRRCPETATKAFSTITEATGGLDRLYNLAGSVQFRRSQAQVQQQTCIPDPAAADMHFSMSHYWNIISMLERRCRQGYFEVLLKTASRPQ